MNFGDRGSHGLALTLPPELVEAIAERAAELVLERVGGGEPASPWLSVDAAAAYLGCSQRHLERAIARGVLHSSTIGRRRLIHRGDLDDYARRSGRGGEAPAAPPHRSRGV